MYTLSLLFPILVSFVFICFIRDLTMQNKNIQNRKRENNILLFEIILRMGRHTYILPKIGICRISDAFLCDSNHFRRNNLSEIGSPHILDGDQNRPCSYHVESSPNRIQVSLMQYRRSVLAAYAQH